MPKLINELTLSWRDELHDAHARFAITTPHVDIINESFRYLDSRFTIANHYLELVDGVYTLEIHVLVPTQKETPQQGSTLAQPS